MDFWEVPKELREGRFKRVALEDLEEGCEGWDLVLLDSQFAILRTVPESPIGQLQQKISDLGKELEDLQANRDGWHQAYYDKKEEVRDLTKKNKAQLKRIAALVAACSHPVIYKSGTCKACNRRPKKSNDPRA